MEINFYCGLKKTNATLNQFYLNQIWNSRCIAKEFVLTTQWQNYAQDILDDMNQDRNVVHLVKFTSSGMEKIALAVVIFLEQNHEMLRPGIS